MNDAEQQNQTKRTELVIQKENLEIRLAEINGNINASIGNRCRAGNRMAPDTFKMEQGWHDERKFITVEMRKINNALSVLKLQSLESRKLQQQSFESNFRKAAKQLLDDFTFNKIIEEAKSLTHK